MLVYGSNDEKYASDVSSSMKYFCLSQGKMEAAERVEYSMFSISFYNGAYFWLLKLRTGRNENVS